MQSHRTEYIKGHSTRWEWHGSPLILHLTHHTVNGVKAQIYLLGVLEACTEQPGLR